jgi:hypothetical protein
MVKSERRTRIVSAFQEHCRTQISDEHIPGMAPPI